MQHLLVVNRHIFAGSDDNEPLVLRLLNDPLYPPWMKDEGTGELGGLGIGGGHRMLRRNVSQCQFSQHKSYRNWHMYTDMSCCFRKKVGWWWCVEFRDLSSSDVVRALKLGCSRQMITKQKDTNGARRPVDLKHNRSEMVAVLGSFEALPCYIHTYRPVDVKERARHVYTWRILVVSAQNSTFVLARNA
jgi:hypothetical protein